MTLTSRGRWFIYADLRDGRLRVESWLPVHNTAQAERVAETARYAYEPRKAGSSSFLKYVGGGVLYAAMAALLLTTTAVLRRRFSAVSGPTARRASA